MNLKEKKSICLFLYVLLYMLYIFQHRLYIVHYIYHYCDIVYVIHIIRLCLMSCLCLCLMTCLCCIYTDTLPCYTIYYKLPLIQGYTIILSLNTMVIFSLFCFHPTHITEYLLYFQFCQNK